jgi:nitronate monooxygenase
MKTRATDLFGIKYPIFCGGIFGMAEPNLCAAISNAGGLGNITAAYYEKEDELREAICQAREKTANPFSVNITMLPSRISEDLYNMYFRVCCEEKVAVIEVSGRPADEYIGGCHKAGIKLIHKVGALKHALHAQKAGYDAVYALGFEAGGHPTFDNVTTMLLTNQLSGILKIPVIAAGGIADGRGLAAALSLGAAGVMMATRFIMTEECVTHQNIKREFIKRNVNDTAMICTTTILQGRALRTPLVEEVLAIEKRGGGFEEIRPLITARRIENSLRRGDVNAAVWYVGQTIGLINDLPKCQELIAQMIKEAKAAAEKTIEQLQ